MPVQTPRVHNKQCEANVARSPAQNNSSARQPRAQKMLMHCCDAWPPRAADAQRRDIELTASKHVSAGQIDLPFSAEEWTLPSCKAALLLQLSPRNNPTVNWKFQIWTT